MPPESRGPVSVVTEWFKSTVILDRLLDLIQEGIPASVDKSRGFHPQGVSHKDAHLDFQTVGFLSILRLRSRVVQQSVYSVRRNRVRQSNQR